VALQRAGVADLSRSRGTVIYKGVYGAPSAAVHPGNAYAASQGGYYTTHHQHQLHHHQQAHPSHHHGYSNSVSSTGTAAYGNAPGGGSHSPSPYLGHAGRLPSVDMGINTLINRGPATGQQ
jgi:hypothetical protein